ncbi:hypothetical protein M5D96_003164 [Drosophila gunungcola]|uniref:Uncharacterized protein n=1 Tax=Drosophila gunungcola TaxID=103775 RepID=A0A9Q0BS76_9MUSC|nr:hypothetical protein M5D96_003164 [Drosophila gunungcola]
METIDPNTRMMMMMLLLWVLLVGPSVFGSPLEIQLLDMMLQEAEGNPSNGRDQRDISVLPATSIGCDESGSPEDFSHLFEDYEESNEECVEFLTPYNASQPSEVIQVIMTTQAAELRMKPEASTTTTVMPTTTISTTTSEPKTTTEESCEYDVETTKVPEFSGCEDGANEKSDDNVVTTTEEPCEDTDEQNTNLCPQFMPAQGSSAHQRPPPAFRFRKPVKNYVEPILYEGNFAKPLQRTAPIGPQQRDYFVSNKQIVPRPRPKYRKRIPPSIYMNNIVRGLDCSDEVSQYPPRTSNQPQRYWDVSPVDFSQRSQGLKKMRPEKNMRSFAPVPIKRQPFYPRSSEENMERQFLRERDTETQYRHYLDEELSQEERLMPPATPTPSLDPCQEEHDRTFYGGRPLRAQKEQLVDYPQPPISSHFFT